jgi:hypothetical protein
VSELEFFWARFFFWQVAYPGVPICLLSCGERERQREVYPSTQFPPVQHVSLEQQGLRKRLQFWSPTVHLLFKQPLSDLPPTPGSSTCTCTLTSKERRKERYNHHRDWVAGGGGQYWFFPTFMNVPWHTPI